MNLLILTQKIDKNDTTLGFFHEWITTFATHEHVESVIVIGLLVREYHFPQNVKVLSLEKEHGISRLKYLFLFFKYIITEHQHYTHVFVHMNQMYVVLGGWFWRLMSKRVGLWYVHRSVTWSLRIATFFANVIFTAAPQSFNINTTKLRIVGHGIDIDHFKKPATMHTTHAQGHFVISSVGRITRIKHLETLVEAAAILHLQKYNFFYELIGPKNTYDDKEYFHELKQMVHSKGVGHLFTFKDAIAPHYMRQHYWKTDINVNLVLTEGMDEVILEGIAGGAVPLVASQSFKELFGQHAHELMFTFDDPQSLAQAIVHIYKRDRASLVHYLQKRVEEEYTIYRVVDKIVNDLGA